MRETMSALAQQIPVCLEAGRDYQKPRKICIGFTGTRHTYLNGRDEAPIQWTNCPCRM